MGYFCDLLLKRSARWITRVIINGFKNGGACYHATGSKMAENATLEPAGTTERINFHAHLPGGRVYFTE